MKDNNLNSLVCFPEKTILNTDHHMESKERLLKFNSMFLSKF